MFTSLFPNVYLSLSNFALNRLVSELSSMCGWVMSAMSVSVVSSVQPTGHGKVTPSSNLLK